jgi:hypothetical protein
VWDLDVRRLRVVVAELVVVMTERRLKLRLVGRSTARGLTYMPWLDRKMYLEEE